MDYTGMCSYYVFNKRRFNNNNRDATIYWKSHILLIGYYIYVVTKKRVCWWFNYAV